MPISARQWFIAEVALCPKTFCEPAKLSEVQTMVVTATFIRLTHLRVFECLERAHDVSELCFRGHDAPLVYVERMHRALA